MSDLKVANEIETITDSLYELCLVDINNLDDPDELTSISHKLKQTYHILRDKVCDILTEECANECAEFRTSYESAEKIYKKKIVAVNKRRVSLGDQNVTELSFRTKLSNIPSGTGSVEKCQNYVDKNCHPEIVEISPEDSASNIYANPHDNSLGVKFVDITANPKNLPPPSTS